MFTTRPQCNAASGKHRFEDYRILECDALQFTGQVAKFRRRLFPPSLNTHGRIQSVT